MKITVGGIYLGRYGSGTYRFKVTGIRKATSDGRIVIDYRVDTTQWLPWSVQHRGSAEVRDFLSRLCIEKWAHLDAVEVAQFNQDGPAKTRECG